MSEVAVDPAQERMEQLPIVARFGPRLDLDQDHLTVSTFQVDPAPVFLVRPLSLVLFLPTGTLECSLIPLVKLNFLLNDSAE
jgi:hypothetical protein